MSKGDKQRSNREAKKPKANKKLTPTTGPTLLKPQDDSRKPAKGSAK